MLKWSKSSLRALEGVHPALRVVFDEVLKSGFDVKAISGVRTTRQQKNLYAQGRTKPGPIVTHADGVHKKSKHQVRKDGFGHALDVYPYPIDLSRKFYATVRFYYLAGLVHSISERLYREKKISVKVRWGGDWNRNNIFSDQSFFDLPHFEIVKP